MTNLCRIKTVELYFPFLPYFLLSNIIFSFAAMISFCYFLLDSFSFSSLTARYLLHTGNSLQFIYSCRLFMYSVFLNRMLAVGTFLPVSNGYLDEGQPLKTYYLEAATFNNSGIDLLLYCVLLVCHSEFKRK